MDRFNKKKIGLILAIIILLLLALVFVFFLFPQATWRNWFKTSQPSGEQGQTMEEKFDEEQAQKERDKVYDFDPLLENRRDWNENDFKSIARSFAERFGSYSNQSDYGNISDLYGLMNSDMKNWADSYVNDLKADNSYSDGYYGIVTEALIEPRIDNFKPESGRVEVTASVQRKEIFASGETKVFDQDIKVSFAKENGVWLVAGAHWQ